MKNKLLTLLVSSSFICSAAYAEKYIQPEYIQDEFFSDRMPEENYLTLAEMNMLHGGYQEATEEQRYEAGVAEPSAGHAMPIEMQVSQAGLFAKDAGRYAAKAAASEKVAGEHSKTAKQFAGRAEEVADSTIMALHVNQVMSERIIAVQAEEQQRLTTNIRAVAKLEKSVESIGLIDKKANENKKKLNTTTNITNANTRSIEKHAGKLDKNSADILKNRQDLRSLENELRETSERLDNGLAASAALNGLFQPYGVGKLNITAAMGGYQSTQALAVGTGYRFNENIAVKTGVAYTGSNDVMYNMAVNLEW